MKYLILLSLISFDLMAEGYHYVRPYVKQDGTFVNGHMQGNPDEYKYNNLNTDYSYKKADVDWKPKQRDYRINQFGQSDD